MIFSFFFVSIVSVVFSLLFRAWVSEKYVFILTYLLLIVDIVFLLFCGVYLNSTGLTYTFVALKALIVDVDFISTFIFLLDAVSSAFATILYVALIICFVFLKTYFEVDFFSKNICFLSAVFSQLALCFFMTGDILSLIFFWEWISIVSFFLIQYWSFRVNTLKVSIRVFIISQLGDLLFICGSFILISITRTTDIVTICQLDSTLQSSIYCEVLPSYCVTILDLALLSLSSAIFLKSAQFIFYPWLLDAMEAPVPISSQLHSSTLVIIGFYVMFRLYPLFINNFFLKNLIIVVGVTTACSMSILAFFQFDGKRLLACSTASQLGYCVVALGFGFVNESFMLLFFCCCNKAILFATFGLLMSNYNGVSDFRLLTKNNLSIFERTALIVIVSNITILPGAFIFHIKSLLSCGTFQTNSMCEVWAIDFLSISWFFSSVYSMNLIRTLFASNFFETIKNHVIINSSVVFSFFKLKYTDIFLTIFVTLLVLCGYSFMTSAYYSSLFNYALNWKTLLLTIY